MSSLVIQFLASFLIWLMLAGVGVLWVIDGKTKKELALHALLAIVVSWVVASVLKEIVNTPRPFQLEALPTFVVIPPLNSAFPSAHTAFAFAMAVTIWLHNKKWGIVYLLLALIIGVARVLANVHYPIDILGGALLGISVALAIEKLHVFELLKKRN